MEEHGAFFPTCFVCSNAINEPKEEEKEPEVAKVVKKKTGAGAISLKNPDGSITTRTAAGQKTTKPLLKRAPTSSTRFGAPILRPQALTRKTSEPAGRLPQEGSPSIPSETPSIPVDKPYSSQIYCSLKCENIEAERSTNLSRKMSTDSVLYRVPSNPPISRGSRRSLYDPTSPLYNSGSDTSSSSNDKPADQAATSAPNFWNIHRDPDEAWRAVNRQRRSSEHPSFRPGQAAGLTMVRNRSQSSSSFTLGEPSSDSLNSVWVNAMGPDIHLGRSISGQGVKRMPPVTEHVPMTGGWPMMGFNSSKSLSLSSSDHSGSPIPAEFGSAPEHTLNLWHSYNNAFSHRDASISATRIPALATTPTHPGMPRRTSSSTLQRPLGGTIRAKTDVSWDAFGLKEVNAKKRQEKVEGGSEHRTPKQTISIGAKGCTISYGTPPMSRRVSATGDHPGALAIPTSNRSGVVSPGRTPTIKASTPNPRVPSSEVPDLAGLRIGNGAGCSPYLSTSQAGSQASAPRSTWNWSKWEKEGGKTYVVPEGSNKGPKPGLFFFK